MKKFQNPFKKLTVFEWCLWGVSMTGVLLAFLIPAEKDIPSLIALSGDLGCSMGPWIMGIVANKTNLQTGFFVSAIFPAIMVLTAPLLRKEKDS